MSQAKGQLTIGTVTNGADGANGKDAYSVMIDHESHAVACDPDGEPLPGELGSGGKAVFTVDVFKGSSKLILRYSQQNISPSERLCYWEILSTSSPRIQAAPLNHTQFYLTEFSVNSGTVTLRFYPESQDTYIDKVVTVVKQIPGMVGPQGETGSAGPMLRPRGVWKSRTEYVKDSRYVDTVTYGGNTYLCSRTHTSGTTWSSSGWTAFNEFINIATQVILANKGTIDVLGAGRMFVGDVNKSKGWEFTNGKIRHTHSGLELTADGKLKDPDGLEFSVGGIAGVAQDTIHSALSNSGTENFIHNSSMGNRFAQEEGGCTINNVYDERMGYCTEITRSYGTGNFQALFHHDIPIGQEVTLSVKAKNISEGVWMIGDSSQSYEMLTSTKYDEKRDLGDGWYLYHKKVTFQSTAYFGVNTCAGKFRMCHLQAEISEFPTSWKPSRKDEIQSGGENLVPNGDFADYGEKAHNWDHSLNGNLGAVGWEDENTGVELPRFGYHVHLNTMKFGYPVYEFKNQNSGCSLNYVPMDAAAWSVDGNYRKSPAISHNGVTREKIYFKTNSDNQTLVIELKSSSESNYDWLFVGNPDDESASSTNYKDRISGTTTKTVSISVPAKGSHFIIVGYKKDGSNNAGSDCGWYRVVSGYDSLAGRWLGASVQLPDFIKKINQGDEYTVSFDVLADTAGHIVSGGVYTHLNNAWNFHDGQFEHAFKANELNRWFRISRTFTSRGSSVNPTLYIYGFNGNEGTAWIKNVSVQKGNKGFWTKSEQDLSTKKELLDTGINIKDRQIVLTADQTLIRDNEGAPIALFENGKLKTSFIDVQQWVNTNNLSIGNGVCMFRNDGTGYLMNGMINWGNGNNTFTINDGDRNIVIANKEIGEIISVPNTINVNEFDTFVSEAATGQNQRTHEIARFTIPHKGNYILRPKMKVELHKQDKYAEAEFDIRVFVNGENVPSLGHGYLPSNVPTLDMVFNAYSSVYYFNQGDEVVIRMDFGLNINTGRTSYASLKLIDTSTGSDYPLSAIFVTNGCTIGLDGINVMYDSSTFFEVKKSITGEMTIRASLPMASTTAQVNDLKVNQLYVNSSGFVKLKL